MIVFSAGMAVLLFMIGGFLLEGWNLSMIVSVIAFISFFEFSTGPILWIYMAEIMYDEA